MTDPEDEEEWADSEGGDARSSSSYASIRSASSAFGAIKKKFIKFFKGSEVFVLLYF